MVKYLFTIPNDIDQVNSNKTFVVSFDVTSIFTNTTPLAETIDIVVNLILGNDLNLEISKKEIIKPFSYGNIRTHFLFNEGFNNHADVIASSLGTFSKSFHVLS